MLITNNIIFIHIPKTAGNSIRRAIKSHTSQGKITDNFERHITLKELKDKIGQRHIASRFTFAFVRNSWDRVLSLYAHVTQRGQNNELWKNKVPHYKNIGFNRWVIEELEYLPMSWGGIQQVDWISPGVDFVGHFENLETDFKRLCKRLNLMSPSLLNLRSPSLDASKTATKHEYYQKAYNEEARTKVAELFADDIKEFEHEFFK